MAACGGFGALGGEPRKTESVVSEAKKIFKLYPVGRVQKKGETAALLIFDKYTDAHSKINKNVIKQLQSVTDVQSKLKNAIEDYYYTRKVFA